VTISLVVTVIGPDRPGLVSLLSERGRAFGASWAQSRMASLAGQFAGIVHFSVPAENAAALAAALHDLSSLGLQIAIAESRAEASRKSAARLLHLELVGQDRPGIVRDISRVLAEADISIEELETELTSAPWSAETLFQAKALLLVPDQVATDALRDTLERLANELMVDIALQEHSAAVST
jgi:glycine cleavage system regulatory protein